MIDAYEIGIQLLLQEDVSAGLVVINRGLGEVDRAIAATSANLTGLVHEAERAAKAVAAAIGRRVPQSSASEPKSAASMVDMPSGSAKQGASVAATAAPVDIVRQEGGELPMAPSKAVPASDGEKSDTPLKSVPSEKINEASAPIKPAGGQMESPARQSPPLLMREADTLPPARLESMAPNSETPRRESARSASPFGTGQRSTPVTPVSVVGIKAAVGQSRATSSPIPGRERVGLQEGSPAFSGQERAAAAPWPAIVHATPSAQARPVERAAAPQSSNRERADGGGGTVMLDGRLVGQWLSEHMAREASRPPGGTSFFDARQTPAWNVSGAL